MSVYSKDECRQRIELINRRKPDFLAAASRSGYVCPLCGNGSGPDGTGLCRNPRNGRWHCFRCGFDGDVLDLFRVRFRIENWGALLAAAALWYGLEPSKERGTDAVPRRNAADSPDPDDVRLPQLTLAAVGTDASADRETDRHRPDSFHAAERSSRDLPPEDCAPADYLDFYRRAAAASTGGYLLGRGISLKVQRRFLIGFVRNWRSDRAVIRALAEGRRAEFIPASPRCIIPRTRSCYLARDVRKNLTAGQQRCCKMAEGRLTEPFHAKALQTAGIVFVTEGEIDAMSVEEAGGCAAALCGIQNRRLYVSCLRRIRHPPVSVLLMDNDAAGADAQEKLIRELGRCHLPCIGAAYPDRSIRDPNDFLVQDRERFAAFIHKTQEAAERCGI